MALTFPTNCQTPEERLSYCYRAQELLRKLHNIVGKWYREGIMIELWNKLPAKIRNRYPYKVRLTQMEWYDFTRNVFDPINGKISSKLSQNVSLVSQAETWQVNLEGI